MCVCLFCHDRTSFLLFGYLVLYAILYVYFVCILVVGCTTIRIIMSHICAFYPGVTVHCCLTAIVLCSIYLIHMCILYLSALVVLCHAVLLVDEERVEDVKVEERRPGCQHQPVFSNIQNQRARRWLHRRQIHQAEIVLH